MPRDEIHRQVARLHRAGIDRGFLATLGDEFLTQMYAAIDAGPDSVLLVEESDGVVAGFVSGARGMGSIYRRMLRRPFALFRALLPAIVVPHRLRRIIELLGYGRREPKSQAFPEPELLSIVVMPEARGRGIADRLYARLAEHFVRHGEHAFRIVVGKDLEPAHRFYRRMGAKATAEIEVHRGEKSIVYVQPLGDPRAGGADESTGRG